jgi:transcription initiation factor IIE alpha subunit
MKKMTIVLSVFLAVISGVSAQNTPKTSQKEVQKTMYMCPMHPKEMSDKEGKCSKCGMVMVKTTEAKYNNAIKGSQSAKKTSTKYICKMDGSTSDKAGKCPKCGMAMTKNETQKMAYACPMHPKEMSDKAEKCPKCGMTMKLKESDEKMESLKK